MVLMKSNLWSNWSHIAIDHGRAAREFRVRLVREWEDSKNVSAMVEETNAALVAITAVAFAIEAFHSDIAPLVGRDPDARSGKGDKQWGHVLATFREAVRSAGGWQRDLEWLTGLRNDAVHFIGLNNPPEPHPAIPTNVAREHVRFSVESADHAIQFLLTVWRGLFEDAKVNPVLVWADGRTHLWTEFAKYAAGREGGS